MSVALLVVLAIAIPVVLAGALLPPILLQDRLQSLSGSFSDDLRKSLAIDRRYKFSVWDIFIVSLLTISAFVPSHVQDMMALGGSIFFAVAAASRSWIYLQARRKFSAELSNDSRRMLLAFGLGAAFLCFVFAVLAASLAFSRSSSSPSPCWLQVLSCCGH
jgi:hypothetical protein